MPPSGAKFASGITSVTYDLTDSSGNIAEHTRASAEHGMITPKCGAASDSTFRVGTTTVHCSATDARGNQGHASFDVNVNALPIIPEAPRGANVVLRVGNPARLGCGYTPGNACHMGAGSSYNVSIPFAVRSARYSAPTKVRITAYVQSGGGWRPTVTRAVTNVSTRQWTYFALNMYPNAIVKFVADSTPYAGARGGVSVRYVTSR